MKPPNAKTTYPDYYSINLPNRRTFRFNGSQFSNWLTLPLKSMRLWSVSLWLVSCVCHWAYSDESWKRVDDLTFSTHINEVSLWCRKFPMFLIAVELETLFPFILIEIFTGMYCSLSFCLTIFPHGNKAKHTVVPRAFMVINKPLTWYMIAV